MSDLLEDLDFDAACQAARCPGRAAEYLLRPVSPSARYVFGDALVALCDPCRLEGDRIAALTGASSPWLFEGFVR